MTTKTNINSDTNCCNSGTCNTDTTGTAVKHPQNYRAPVDVFETSTEYRVVADMPGASIEGIAISINDNMLVIDATVEDRYETLGRIRHQEYGVGDFRRSFRIGTGIDAATITANYRDGVLYLTLPKAKCAEPRKIDIRTN